MAKVKADPSKKHQISEGQELEVTHLAENTDLSPKQARELLKRYGPLGEDPKGSRKLQG